MKSYSEMTTYINYENGIVINGWVYIARDNITIDYKKTYYFYSVTQAKRIHKKELSKIKKLYNSGNFERGSYNTIKINNEILNYYYG